MREVRWCSALSLLYIVVVACTTGPSIRVDKDPAVDLSQYKTFSFFDQVATDRAGYSTLVTDRLKQATRTQLERVGYRYAGYYGYRRGMYGAWGGYPYDVQTVNYREGTLSIDLVDAKKNQLVWQGIAEGRVKEEARKNPGPAIDAVVAEIFRAFPNAPSG